MRRLSIELPESLHQQIKAEASLQGLSMRAYVLQRLGLINDRAADSGEKTAERLADSSYEPGSMRELLHSRDWRGERTRAEIDAQVAEERAAWPEHDSNA